MLITSTEKKQLIKPPLNIRQSKAVSQGFSELDQQYVSIVREAGTATTRTMADALGVTTSTASHKLRHLVDRGYLESVQGSHANSPATYKVAK